MNAQSYTAANAFPAKLLKRAAKAVNGHGIRPLHVQFSPTNRCNLKCGFCSCSERDKRLEMDYTDAHKMILGFSAQGCEALTITGGGEPTLWPRLNDLLRLCYSLRIQTGLVTNGLTLGEMGEWAGPELLTWCRVSFSDERTLDQDFIVGLTRAVETFRTVDWAVSYVLTREPDITKLTKVILLANALGLTHVRVVPDLTDLGNVPDPLHVRDQIEATTPDLDLSRVIFQPRHGFERGAERCLISLLKPVVDAGGRIFPCCGVQYAREERSLDFDPAMTMAGTIEEIWNGQRRFDGSKCATCYYGDYNRALAMMTTMYEHEVFV